MHKLRQIIRLYYQGTGIKTIHGMIGVSRNTIKKYLRRRHELGLNYDSFIKKSDAELSTLFSADRFVRGFCPFIIGDALLLEYL